MFVPSLKEAEKKKKKDPKEEFSQLDILLIVALILAFILSLLAIILEPRRLGILSSQTNNSATNGTTPAASSDGNTMAEEAVTIVGFIILAIAVIIRLILLCACEKNFQALSISVIVLTAVGFVLFVVATSLSFMITPPYGSWAIAGSATSLLSLLNAIFLYLMNARSNPDEVA
ncbi:hypothetical protein EG68_01820 [Paragonimus skrjabini miyazakii]|uniref:Uncharacterized protein n=1 Tax=Paragonimus skrjabini miyazakii TaxID=59628 RepID=A0A8S9Z4Y8_9TREM|nr:hypothetical protein EG68_01820 [Paragonimus skrjabini miyazakii]